MRGIVKNAVRRTGYTNVSNVVAYYVRGAMVIGRSLWYVGIVERQRKAMEQYTLADAEGVAMRTRALLETRGWCKWRCARLGGVVVGVARDDWDALNIPGDHPTFTEAELRQLSEDDADEGMLLIAIEAKRLAGARVIVKEE